MTIVMTEATTQPSASAMTIQTADRVFEIWRQGMAQADLLDACRGMHVAAAVLLIFGGLVFLLWGFYAFKMLVTLNAAILGAWLGMMLGQRFGSPLAAAAVGSFAAAVVTWPLMKYAVAIMGGLIGTVVGMSLWRAAGLDPHFAAAGGGMGLIFGGMISFILFRTSVMAFTSLQGSLMLIFGALSVIYKFQNVDTSVIDAKLLMTPMMMPMAVGFATVCGIIYQNSQGGGPTEAEKK